ncbi:TlpA family protein disulfide reductase [Nannocystis bainbridge]|uniref:TlpA disulfide reductase family protein n=1 Tax=Nannocystis bainbridge TaxID=2995303 RepID=A0ABT5E764_9BACT|nr:TlpA disulfide reductase family protein [Nannocystis bainbridge]MDC0721515.1 TlpA disulfide reductase family protein [Nannocystis bainbridge]
MSLAFATSWARAGIAAWGLVLGGCGAAADLSVGPTPSTVAAPVKEVGEARAAVTVGGRLRAHDGRPLRAAEFTIQRMGFIEPTAKGTLAEDGSFRVEVEPGIYMFSIAAIDHAGFAQTILVERAVEVRGNLGTYKRADPGDALLLRTELLAADGKPIATGNKTAVREADGTYRLDLSDKPKHAVKLRYQLRGGNGRTYNGPLADTYESDGGGDYWSVVALAGRDALALDLTALPPAGEAAALTWSGEPPELLALRAYRDRWRVREARLRDTMLQEDGKILAPTENEKAAMAALAAEADADADAAESADAQMLLRLAHLELFTAYDDDAAARTRAEWLLERVVPDDPRLGLFRNVNSLLGRVLQSADAAFSARVEAWFGRMQANPDPNTALRAISFLIHRADQRNDDARIAELYALARGPRFSGMHEPKSLAQRFDPDRILQRGKPFPEFEFPALAADGRPVTRAGREGRLYLVEFWATWCAPCVSEIPGLHAAYAHVNGARPGKGKDGMRRLGPVERPKIEFVFVSLDESPGDVEAFREKHWSMPWTHAFVGRGREKEVMERFGFSGVPTAVLVDGNGTIVEVGGALRRERLLPTLERALERSSAR